jgi:hypothetical protein
MKIELISSVLLASAFVTSIPAMAKDFTLTGDPDQALTVHASCLDKRGKASESDIRIAAGETSTIGDADCETFGISISTHNESKNGYVKSYDLEAGHAYYVHWTGKYWDIREEQ